nr:hypothetical protein [Candidatus Gracilibacteria bacterium]
MCVVNYFLNNLAYDIQYMKNYNRNRRLQIKDNTLLDQIANSIVLTEQEKLNFLKYIAYLTEEESQELSKLI